MMRSGLTQSMYRPASPFLQLASASSCSHRKDAYNLPRPARPQLGLSSRAELSLDRLPEEG